MQIRDFIPKRIQHLMAAPADELTRWQFAVRYFFEVLRHGAIRLRQDHAGQMAAALSFRTLFGLIPVLVIAMVLFRAFGGTAVFHSFVGEAFDAAGLGDVTVPIQMTTDSPDNQGTVNDDAQEPEAGERDASAEELVAEDLGQTADESEPAENVQYNTVALTDWVTNLIDQIDDKVSFNSIGLVGLLVLAWAAISLLTTIERTFNTVCQAPGHRSLARRVPLYWMTITIGPGLLYLSFYVSHKFDDFMAESSTAAASALLIGWLSSFGSTWLFLLLLFMFMPNTRMNLTATCFGALISALLWTGLGELLGAYLSTVFRQSARFSILYGSLGLLPVFMLWVYFMWLIVLFGLEISSTLQAVGGTLSASIRDREPLPLVLDPLIVIPIMETAASRFEVGKTVTPEMIAEQVRINMRASRGILRALTEKGMLFEMDAEAESEQYTLGRPPNRIRLTDLVAVGQSLASMQTRDSKAWMCVEGLKGRIRADLTDAVLSDLIESEAAAPGPDPHPGSPGIQGASA
ncbi:MAG: YihY/virulence factor BrkB family protein [Planctomycetes bacterium]|nr:YihY/virulence factor BrkB family protein [Planctomycetota bacterium]